MCHGGFCSIFLCCGKEGKISGQVISVEILDLSYFSMADIIYRSEGLLSLFTVNKRKEYLKERYNRKKKKDIYFFQTHFLTGCS